MGGDGPVFEGQGLHKFTLKLHILLIEIEPLLQKVYIAFNIFFCFDKNKLILKLRLETLYKYIKQF